MKQKNDKMFIILLIGIGAFALFTIYDGAINFGGGLFSQFGFSTLSLDRVTFDSNSPDVAGDAWVLTVSATGQAQSADLFISADQLSTSTEEAQDSLRLDIDSKIQEAVYPIQQEGSFLYKVKHTANEDNLLNPFDSSEATLQAQCRNTAGYYVVHTYSKSSTVREVVCFTRTKEGDHGTILNPSIRTETDIVLSSSGKEARATIDSKGDTSANLFWNGQKVGRAEWVGSLVSGETEPRAFEQKIDALYYTGGFSQGWRTISSTSWDNWDDYNNAGFGTCLNGNPSGFQTCENNYNNLANSATNVKYLETASGSRGSTSGSFQNGQVSLTLDNRINFPNFVIAVSADFVDTIEIFQGVGEPRLSDLKTETFTTGDRGQITGTIENVGTAQGSFGISAQCGTGFSMEGSTIFTGTMNPGATQFFSIPIRSNVANGDQSTTCEVTAFDRGDADIRVSDTITVTSSAIALCEQGHKRPDKVSNTIEQCQENSWKVIETCGSGFVAEATSPTDAECVDITSKEDCGLLGLGCKTIGFPKLGGGLGLGLGFAGAIALVLFIVFLASKSPITVSRRR